MIVDKPRILVFPVTYRCNAKCAMCKIWENDAGPELTIEQIREIFDDSLLSNSVEFINVTGGECFLRDDLVELIKIWVEKCPSLISIGIASNGFMTSRIVKTVERMVSAVLPSNVFLTIGFSFDGVGSVHDRVRRVPGGFERVCQTVQEMKKLERLYWPKLGVSVGTNINSISIESIQETRDFLKQRNISTTYTPVVTSDLFFNNVENRDNFELNQEQRINLLAFYEELRRCGEIDSFYYKFVQNWLRFGKRTVGCIFQTSGLFIEPNGDVYPCKTFKKLKLGNLLNSKFSDIWTESVMRPVYKEMMPHCGTCGCNCFLEKANLISKVKRKVYNTLFN